MNQRISEARGHGAITAFVATVALVGIGCGQTPEVDRIGTAEISVHALSAASISSANLTVSGDALPKPRMQALYQTNGQWGAVLGGLPAAKGYTFSTTAVAIDGTVYSGSTS